MVRDIAKSNHAIAEAWKREKGLVEKGMGTRDWTPDQQRDILATGKVHDADGKAFEGHHMKCVSQYPNFQGDLNNIQFLSRDEHIKAHGGKTQNPTNGYYDFKKEKTTILFEEDKLIPITPFSLTELADEVKAIMEENGLITDSNDAEEENRSSSSNNIKTDSCQKPPEQHPELMPDIPNTATISEDKAGDSDDILRDYLAAFEDYEIPDLPYDDYDELPLREEKRGLIQRITDWKEDFQERHPLATAMIEGGFQVVEQLGTQWVELQMDAIADEIECASERRSSGSNTELPDIPTPESAETPDATHSSPREHEVGEHRQRYHTKHGVEWREKEPYKRGGNKDSD